MGNDFYRKLGAVFLIAAAAVYTVERVGAKLASGILAAGWFGGKWNGEVPKIETAGFFDNLFVPVFTLVGVILFVYGFPRK